MADLTIHLTLKNNRHAYEPGETVRGNVAVMVPGGPVDVKSAELLLFWRTSGIGDTDEGVVSTVKLVEPGGQLPSAFSRDFDLVVPPTPWSYSGRLVKINWFLGVYIKQAWRSSDDVEIALEVRPTARSSNGGDNPQDTVPHEVEIFYDERGNPVPRPLNI